MRFDWTVSEAEALFGLPLPELIFQAQQLHRRFFDPWRGSIFDAGANSVFVGAKLLTTDNPTRLHDDDLIARLGMRCVQAA